MKWLTVILTILLLSGLSTFSEASDLECRGDGTRILTTWSASVGMNAYLFRMGENGNQLIGQYQVTFGNTTYDMHGKGFDLMISETQNPAGFFPAQYDAYTLGTHGYYSGNLLCKGISQPPLNPPSSGVSCPPFQGNLRCQVIHGQYCACH
jgi:hypothetical protein